MVADAYLSYSERSAGENQVSDFECIILRNFANQLIYAEYHICGIARLYLFIVE